MNSELIEFKNSDFGKKCEEWLTANLKDEGPILYSTLGHGKFLPDSVTVSDWVASVSGVTGHPDLFANEKYCEDESLAPDSRAKRTSPNILPKWMRNAHLGKTYPCKGIAPRIGNPKRITFVSAMNWLWRFLTGWMHGKSHVSSKVWTGLVAQLNKDSSLTVWIEYCDKRQSFTASAFLSGDDESMVVRSRGVCFAVIREEVSALKLLPKIHEEDGLLPGSICSCKVTAWYAEKGEFGFARDVDNGATYFFNRALVQDYALLQSLQQGELGQLIESRIINAAFGKKYAKIEVLRMKAQEKKIGNAPLPSGNSPKARAVRAEHSGDLQLAEQLYLSILKNPHNEDFESALKNLASIYNRTNPNRALLLLAEHEKYVSDECKVTLDNLRFLYYRKAGRDREAYKIALKQLKIKPNANYSKFVEEFRRQGSDKSALSKRQDANVNSEYMIPSDMRYGGCLMRIADFGGWVPEDAEPDSIKSRLDHLESLGEEMASEDKSGESGNRDSSYEDRHAAYSLQRATLRFWWAERTDSLVKMGKARAEWRNYFYWMARKFSADGGSYCLDQIETMLVWAARCAKRDNRNDYCQVAYPLAIAKFELGIAPEVVWQLLTTKNESELLLELNTVAAEVATNESAKRRLMALLNNYALQDVMPNLARIVQSDLRVDSGYLDVLNRVGMIVKGTDVVLSDHLVKEANAIAILLTGRAGDDQERVGQFSVLMKLVEQYASAVNYEYKRSLCEDIKRHCENFVNRYVYALPTLYTTDVYYPLLSVIQDCVQTDFARLALKEVPLKLEIISEPNEHEDRNEITLELRLSSESEASSTIVSAAFFVENDFGNDADETPAAIYSGEGIKCGSPYVFNLDITPLSSERDKGVALLTVRVRYSTDGGYEGEQVFQCQYKLLTKADLLDYDNPYSGFQGAVATGEYFVGRESEMSKIRRRFNGSMGGQCFVLWGQRRSGKSSIRDNFGDELRRMSPNVVYTILDAQSWSGEYVRHFTDSLCSGVETWCVMRQLKTLDNAKIPGLCLIKDEAYDVRIQRVADFLHMNGMSLIVALDEASTPFNNYIDRGQKEEDKYAAIDFMRFLKSMVNGSRHFHLLLIGQDTMKDYLENEDFGNEFSVCTDKELSYLSKADIEKLFLKGFPDCRSGRRRITPEAFDELYRLTSGAPYLVQIFCYWLHEHLFENELPVADMHAIEETVKILCFGRECDEGRLAWRNFEQWTNLHVPGVTVRDVQDFFCDMVGKIGENGWCRREELVCSDKAGVIFDVLKMRHVFSECDGRFRIKVELFTKWLLVNRENV